MEEKTLNKMEELKNKLVKYNKKAKKLEKKILKLKKTCKHESLEKTNYDTATCNICGKYFSWYCPTSPTLECDYNQEDGSYDEDSCRYCGDPEERK